MWWRDKVSFLALADGDCRFLPTLLCGFRLQDQQRAVAAPQKEVATGIYYLARVVHTEGSDWRRCHAIVGIWGPDSIPALLSGEFKLELLGPPDILPE